jgi:hypothetical protein
MEGKLLAVSPVLRNRVFRVSKNFAEKGVIEEGALQNLATPAL